MAKISIKNFSCIEHAELELARINILIGAQGSGKSVTTKMIYFFTELMQGFIRHAEENISFPEYKVMIEKKFTISFPPQAWGDRRFQINFSSGEFDLRVLRRKIAGRLSSEINMKFSKWFEDMYEYARQAFNDAASQKKYTEHSTDFNVSLERSWRVYSEVTKRIEDTINGDYFSQQTFIPAGRAFFTSIGRLVAGIEHAGSLDPVTLTFAKQFAGWRDSSGALLYHTRDEDFNNRRDRMMLQLFNGKVFTRNEAEYIEMQDGRKVPFSYLSSGQQELLPIWFFIDNLLLQDAFRERRSQKTNFKDRHLVYIEEPEAHLFPSAQSALMDLLVGAILGHRSNRYLIITTHSPYIMSKLNVYLKAGQISRRKKRNLEISEVVDRECWMRRDQLSAWSVIDGQVKSIVDETDGLIDAAYLDSISDSIMDQFSRLLEIEAGI